MGVKPRQFTKDRKRADRKEHMDLNRYIASVDSGYTGKIRQDEAVMQPVDAVSETGASAGDRIDPLVTGTEHKKVSVNAHEKVTRGKAGWSASTGTTGGLAGCGTEHETCLLTLR